MIIQYASRCVKASVYALLMAERKYLVYEFGLHKQAPVDTSLIKGALKYRHFVLGILAIFLYMGIEVGTPTYVNMYLVNTPELGINAATAGLIVAVYWALMMVGRFVGASIGSKVSSRAMITTV